jgi:alpha-methylacyl-CoA racemase
MKSTRKIELGTLDGYKIVELAGIGPGPMAGMILADMGAEVIIIERPGNSSSGRLDVSHRGKKSIVINLKNTEGLAIALKLIARSDVLIDPYRPGVCEKLGIGPETCLKIRPELIYGRITGWGQDGPLAQAAGHDINYISITGVLHAIGNGEQPVIPLNLVGDMGGGGMLLVNGILAALLERHRSGKGQVIDAAMVDGCAQQMWMTHSMQSTGQWDVSERHNNMLDGGAHYYNVYRCSDDKFVSLGAIEPQFYKLFIKLIDPDNKYNCGSQKSQDWKQLKSRLSELFSEHPRDYWCDLLEGTDACFAPVLDIVEAPQHPANLARNTYNVINGQIHPSPAPRFSRTPSSIRPGPNKPGSDTEQILKETGMSDSELSRLTKCGAVG